MYVCLTSCERTRDVAGVESGMDIPSGNLQGWACRSQELELIQKNPSRYGEASDPFLRNLSRVILGGLRGFPASFQASAQVLRNLCAYAADPELQS